MLDGYDGLFDTVALIFLLAILVTVVIGLVLLGSLPGDIARKRGHPQTAAITALGWIGLLFVVGWPIAFVWAFTVPPGVKS